jgi:hypothetical protein
VLVFRAGGGAIAAVVAASLVNFAAQAIAAWWIADANLLEFESMAQLSVSAVLGIYAFGAIAALPVTFVPLLVLLDRVPLRAAFVASGSAFARNTLPLLYRRYRRTSGIGLLTAARPRAGAAAVGGVVVRGMEGRVHVGDARPLKSVVRPGRYVNSRRRVRFDGQRFDVGDRAAGGPAGTMR